MDKEFVPYQPSVDMKELGFNEPCFIYWVYDGVEITYSTSHNKSGWSMIGFRNNQMIKKAGLCTAPTFSQAFRWFREKYGYDIHIKGTHFRASYVIGIPKEINMKSVDGYPLVTSWDYIIDETGKRNTYEEAELTCLIKLIEIAKNK